MLTTTSADHTESINCKSEFWYALSEGDIIIVHMQKYLRSQN